MPWIFLFGDLYFENRTPNQLLLFEVLLPISFIVNALIIYQLGKFAGRVVRAKHQKKESGHLLS